ncbi:MAG: TetR family transcriptional regulator [Rhodospirillales bacterium]|nr:TetR family transcriptional regulator [Rhodospirillales bacterium]MCB9995243.1 TetR family transcriptional regulator [Rhodospirillales bacterium]
MAKSTRKPVKEKALKAALELAASQGWASTSLADIAAHAKIPMTDLHDVFEDRFDILAAYGRMLDRRVLEAAGEPDPSLSPRDRLFDLLMERFDALNDDRDGVLSILNSLWCDPKQAVINLPHLGRSMSWMLEAAGIETSGIRGAIKIAGLTALYLKTLKTWSTDDSPDMGKTMAALDQSLGRAEQWAGSFGI